MALRKKTRKKQAAKKKAAAPKTSARKQAAPRKAPAAAAKSEVAVEAAAAPASLEDRLMARVAEMERMFEPFRRRAWLRPMSFEGLKWPDLPFEGRFPSCDVVNREKDIQVKAEVPGIDKDDISVTVTDRTLTIKGETRHEEEKEEGDHHHREIRTGSFSRTLTLPEDVDGNKAKAGYKDGVLELTLPKRRKAKKHEVKVG